MTMNQGQSVTLCIIVMCAAASSSAFMATNPRGFNRRYQTKSYTKSRHRNFSESLFQQEMTEQPSKSPKAEETIKSLRRLLERQQADMEMTKDILNSIEQAKLSEGKDEKQHKSLSASLLNGFDYGFVSRSEGGTYSEIKGDLPAYAPPGNVWKLGWGQFFRNLEAMKGEYREEVDVNLTSGQVKLREKLDSLTLDSRAIWQREEKTEVQAPIVVKVPYLLLCWLLDVLFEGQYVFSRFFLLETVARMPYFSYISMIHLYETLGRNTTHPLSL